MSSNPAVSREAAARFIEHQFDRAYECPREKGPCFHYGLQDLRVLMDFIYGGAPVGEEHIRGTRR